MNTMKKLLLIVLMAFSMIANAQGLHWTYNSHTQYNMTITGEMYLDGVSLKTNPDAQYLEIGVFYGDECRGAYLPIHNPASYYQGYAYMMQVYSNAASGEEMNFKVYNHQTNEEMDVVCTSGFTFQSDANLGTLKNPYHLNFFSPVEITASANPAVGGTVAGAGTYDYNSSCTLTATASTGYTFANWTKGGEVVSADAEYTFTVTEAGAYVANFTLNSYQVTATANPEAGGTVIGAGTYNHGATATLTATANTGYTFINWTKNGQQVSTNASFSVTVTEAAAYVANFQLNSYAITATATPTAGGTVTGAGTYNHGATATLVATPATGYHFVNWTKNGQQVATTASYSFTVTEAGTYVANFAINTYAITASVTPANSGSVTGAGTYNHGATATLVATPATGYHFVNWTKNGQQVSTNATYSFTVTEAGAYVANFAINTYAITATANPTAGGTVTGAGTYNHGATATLAATANTGYTFINWTKNGQQVSTNATLSVTVTEAAAYVANFQLNSYAITVSATPTAGGTVIGAGTYNHGATATLTATANTGYHFVKWTKNGQQVSTNATYSFTVTEAAAYVANFELNSYAIGATANPTAGGTVTGAGNYNHFATATLTASANTSNGYHFVNWTKNGDVVSTNATYSFTVTEAVNLVANFALNNYNVTVSANPTAGGTVTGGGSYNWGTTAHLVATPATGYSFTNWTKNGTVVSTSAAYDLTVTESGAYVANFALNVYSVAASATPAAGGTITGAGNYEHGATATLTATAATGYTFQKWTKNGQQVSTNATYSFTVNSAVTLVAHFTLNSYAVTTTANPTAGGTVTGAGTYNHGATATLTATANTGYTFVNWTKGGTVVSTNASYSFTVTEAGAYTANFQLKSYNITAAATPTAGGTVTGAGTYNHGASCTLVATPNTGYTFVNWKKGSTVVSTNASYTFTVTEAGSYTATFQLNSYAVTTTANPAAGGTVTGAGTYNHGATATLTATANTGYTFVNWTKGGTVVSTNATYSFTVTEAGAYTANFQLNSYNITAAATPAAGGIVTGAGTYNHGASCTLVATPNTGYTFVNWKKGTTVVSTNASYTFTVTEAGSYTATFQLNSYVITATANPTAGGTVTGAGTYNHGATVTLAVTANTGYTFVNWTKNGTVVSTDKTYIFTATEAGDYVANFSLNSYTITTTAAPTYGGTVSGAGTYSYGTSVTLSATPTLPAYHFVNWTKNGQVVSSDANYSFTVTESGDYVANFATNNYQVTAFATPAEGGEVSGSGTYAYGQTCVLNAMPNENYYFIHWKKNDNEIVSTNANYLFEVYENAAYVAYFALNAYEITATANPTNGGTIEGTGNYEAGMPCTLTAIAAEGFTFVNWTDATGATVSTNAAYTFTVTGDASYVANFTLNSYAITATANPTEGGTVTGAGTYNHGASCTLTATANAGYNFINWTKDNEVVSTNASYTFTVTEAGAYIANFEVNAYEITVVANPEEGGTVTGAGTYVYGVTAVLVATPSTDYDFINWTKGNEVVSTNPTYTFTVTESGDYIANFEEIIIPTYVVTVTADPAEGGTVTGGGVYEEGETVTVIAAASEGFAFQNWTENGEIVSEEAEYTFVVTADRNLVAHFDVDGIDENNGISYNIYPNPVSDKLIIESQANITVVEIYSLSGNLILKESGSSTKVEIDVNSLSAGSYLIRMTSDGMTQVKRFIKK